MKKMLWLLALTFVCGSATVLPARAQQAVSPGKETYTGTVISIGGQRSGASNTFSLIINGQTSDEQAKQYLSVLQADGQDGLLKAGGKENLGSFSVGAQLGRTINFVRETQVEGRRRIFIVFERWMQFAELRGGYRSTDYPFGVIELFVDDATGKGEGTYIAAARIRWDVDRKTERSQVEIENFATFPAKLMGVIRRGAKPAR